MFQKINSVIAHYRELENLLRDPAVIADADKYNAYAKEYKELFSLVELGEKYLQIQQDIEEYNDLIAHAPEDEAEIRAEIAELKEEVENLEPRLKRMLMPKDPLDDKNVILEIRSGVGGEEAALFAADLFRMYLRFAEREKFKFEVLSKSSTDLGGIKEVTALVSGYKVYSKLKFESGAHRVQRVPETESSGRIHTSAVTVAIMPEVEDIEVQIDPKDLKIDTFRASGAGGQYVNKTESAIRITHLPTGITVECQDEKSQLKNKEKAMKVILARVGDAKRRSEKEKTDSLRKEQVGSGDRSERIRTYNFPQGRVTDHRINYTSHRLSEFIDGDMSDLIDALIVDDQTKKLSKFEE